jgi:hypothetical protein
MFVVAISHESLSQAFTHERTVSSYAIRPIELKIFACNG